MISEKKSKPPFWKRVREAQKRKHTKAQAKLLHAAIWGVTRRLSDFAGRIRMVTASGQHLSPKRELRREAEMAGLAPSGRQWRKVRKQMRREEKAIQRGERAA
jgi:hypothetical protein